MFTSKRGLGHLEKLIMRSHSKSRDRCDSIYYLSICHRVGEPSLFGSFSTNLLQPNPVRYLYLNILKMKAALKKTEPSTMNLSSWWSFHILSLFHLTPILHQHERMSKPPTEEIEIGCFLHSPNILHICYPWLFRFVWMKRRVHINCIFYENGAISQCLF